MAEAPNPWHEALLGVAGIQSHETRQCQAVDVLSSFREVLGFEARHFGFKIGRDLQYAELTIESCKIASSACRKVFRLVSQLWCVMTTPGTMLTCTLSWASSQIL